MFVVHKLAEDIKLLPQELVGEIHLAWEERKCIRRIKQTEKADLGEKYKPSKTQADRHIHTPDMLTHRGVHDACAVCPDGVGNVSDVDGV